MGEWQIRSDIDIVGPAHGVIARLVGWWDKRFELPERFCLLRITPAMRF
jgi:hypothetical protein